TGAIMGVPAHDERDFEFATRYDLPIVKVVEPAGGAAEDEGPFVAHTPDERLVNSGQFRGMSSPEAKGPIVEWLEDRHVDRAIVDYWLPVNQYIGGVEHAILHLLYARFFTKVMYEGGLVGFKEPFARLFTQGMVHYHGAKMSKSRGNVVDPDEYVDRHGADAVRLYLLCLGPVDQDAEGQDKGFEGMVRFLHRLWRVALEQADRPAGEPPPAPTPLGRKAHET